MKHKKEVFIAALIIVFLIAIGPSIKKQVGIYTKGKILIRVILKIHYMIFI